MQMIECRGELLTYVGWHIPCIPRLWEKLFRIQGHVFLSSGSCVISHESLCASYMRSRFFLPCAYRLEVKYCWVLSVRYTISCHIANYKFRVHYILYERKCGFYRQHIPFSLQPFRRLVLPHALIVHPKEKLFWQETNYLTLYCISWAGSICRELATLLPHGSVIAMWSITVSSFIFPWAHNGPDISI